MKGSRFKVFDAVDKAVRMTIPPGMAQAFKNTGNAAGLLTAFTDVDRDDALADIVEDILLEPCPQWLILLL